MNIRSLLLAILLTPMLSWGQGMTWYDQDAITYQENVLYDVKIKVKQDGSDEAINGATVSLYRVMDDDTIELWDVWDTEEGVAWFGTEPGSYRVSVEKDGQTIWYSKKPSIIGSNPLYVYRNTTRTIKMSPAPVLQTQEGQGIIILEDVPFELQCDCPASVYAWIGSKRLPSTWIWVNGSTLYVNPKSNVPPGPFYVTDKRTGAKSNEIPAIIVDDQDGANCVVGQWGACM